MENYVYIWDKILRKCSRNGNFFLFIIINFGHMESLNERTKIISRSVLLRNLTHIYSPDFGLTSDNILIMKLI